MTNKINFEPIGEALKAFDTDKIDIGRKVEIINPDGTTGETSAETPLYKDIACHISFKEIDNPDPNTAETMPILKALQINCPLEVDLQNGDLITAYKLSANGTIIETYTGLIGEPSSSMSRKSAEMQVKANI